MPTNSTDTTTGSSDRQELDVVVIGAGFAGLYATYLLRERGLRFRVFESAGDVGGTWYWNRYPGARCDVESFDYRFTFLEELHEGFEWSERYAAQPEILRYANFVADTLDLRRHMTFDAQVTGIVWDDESSTYEVTLKSGESVRTRFVITSVGLLSTSSVPNIPGLDAFEGRTLHTGRWPHEPVDFTGRRVAVIGTGSSGIQVIPEVAAVADQVVVFQRTANYSLPANNRPLSNREKQHARGDREFVRDHALKTSAGYYSRRSTKSIFDDSPEERQAELERRWQIGGFEFLSAYMDVAASEEANEELAKFVRAKVRATVKDPAVADKLEPRSHPIMGKRPTVNNGYYEAFNRPNVTLVDINDEPIVEVTANSVVTSAGVYEVDDLVTATGFDAVSGPLLRMGIKGVGGVSLTDEWADGSATYLGIAIAKFPNLFTVTGPMSATPLTNVMRSIEHHLEWIMDCLDHMRDNGFTRIVATPAAQEGWDKTIAEVGTYTVHAKTASWYTGGNIEGKPMKLMAWVGGLDNYAVVCQKVADDGYTGFELSTSDVPASV